MKKENIKEIKSDWERAKNILRDHFWIKQGSKLGQTFEKFIDNWFDDLDRHIKKLKK